MQRGWLAGDASQLAAVLLCYLTVIGVTATLCRSTARTAGDSAISVAAYVTIFADVAALTAVSAVITRRGAPDWVLVVGFFVVHIAEFSFGRRASILAAASTVAGYSLLALGRGGLPLAERVEFLIATVSFVAVTSTFLAQYASRRRRLRRIIALFERAEEGDFTEAYDVAADRRPDAVTAVGGAYNRVRARFESLVLTDSLTGCLNRRGFDQALERELARADRTGTEVAMLAIDIDDFKRVNDTFGHMAGDETLQQFGRLLRARVRIGDVVARVGGDEFVILCPATGVEGAQELGESLRSLVAGHDFRGQGLPVRVTMSGGVAAIEATDADHTAAELKLRADRALYDAKHAGRNRIRSWAMAGV